MCTRSDRGGAVTSLLLLLGVAISHIHLAEAAPGTIASSIANSTRSISAIPAPCKADTCGAACTLGSIPMNRTMAGIFTSEASPTTICTDSLPTASWGILSTAFIDTNVSSVASPTASPQKRTLPSVMDPASYVIELGKMITAHQQWAPMAQGTTTDFWMFPDQNSVSRDAVGVNGLYGCTAIVIVSDRGVFTSHIWEVPSFVMADESPADDETFWANSYDMLKNGNPEYGSVGIQDLAEPGLILNGAFNPIIFVITPLTVDAERELQSITTRLRYEEKINRLAESLQGLIPGAPAPFVVGYDRADPADSLDDEKYTGKVIIEVDPMEAVLANEQHPELPPLYVGAWRVWVANQEIMQQSYLHPIAGMQKRIDNDADFSRRAPAGVVCGSSLTSGMYAPPSATAAIASTNINVGTLTSDALYISVSHALTSLCPVPTSSGESTGCKNSSVTIGGVAYFDEGSTDKGDASPPTGDLVVKVPISSYNSTELRDAMIAIIAMSTNSSAVGPSCNNETIGSSANTAITFCNAPQLVLVNYTSAKYETSEDPVHFAMEIEYIFEQHTGGMFDCDLILDSVNTGLTALDSKFVIDSETPINNVTATCNALAPV